MPVERAHEKHELDADRPLNAHRRCKALVVEYSTLSVGGATSACSCELKSAEPSKRVALAACRGGGISWDKVDLKSSDIRVAEMI